MAITIYHNPRCSKSRETLALLSSKGIQPTVIEYLKTPINHDELDSILLKLGFTSAHQLVRNKESVYKELRLNKDSDESVIRDAMIANPKLIERPIVISGKNAILGRPPENVLSLIN